MKKWYLSLTLIFLMMAGITGSDGAQSVCESKCSLEKNKELQFAGALRGQLEKCRPEFLKCIAGEGSFAACQKSYSECKWTKTREIKEKNIELNNNYRACVGNCIGFVPTSGPNTQISSFCKSLETARENLVGNLGKEGFEKTWKMNGCAVRAFKTL